MLTSVFLLFKISKFEDLAHDQLLCISTGAAFMKPQDRNREIEAKANWGRVRKSEGDEATHIQVSASQNPIVDVDPFGPPLVASRTSLTYYDEFSDDNNNNNSNSKNSMTSSEKLRNLRFQHQNKRAIAENNKVDSLVD